MSNNFFKLYLKLFDAGSFLGCHQMPERSFFIGNWQFPVCARCFGVFIGQAAFFVLFFFGLRMPILVDIIFLGIMFLDWLLQFVKILKSTNVRRFATGFLAGMGLFSIYSKVIIFLIYLFNYIQK